MVGGFFFRAMQRPGKNNIKRFPVSSSRMFMHWYMVHIFSSVPAGRVCINGSGWFIRACRKRKTIPVAVAGPGKELSCTAGFPAFEQFPDVGQVQLHFTKEKPVFRNCF